MIAPEVERNLLGGNAEANVSFNSFLFSFQRIGFFPVL